MRNGAPAPSWLLLFSDRNAAEVTFAPSVDHAGALGHYPDAVAAEPTPGVEPSVDIAADVLSMFEACAAAGLYDDDDRASLMVMWGIDPAGARLLVEDMHGRVDRCRRCVHFRRPGFSDGYCSGRNDLPTVHGRLHALPVDGGAWCGRFDLSQSCE